MYTYTYCRSERWSTASAGIPPCFNTNQPNHSLTTTASHSDEGVLISEGSTALERSRDQISALMWRGSRIANKNRETRARFGPSVAQRVTLLAFWTFLRSKGSSKPRLGSDSAAQQARSPVGGVVFVSSARSASTRLRGVPLETRTAVETSKSLSSDNRKTKRYPASLAPPLGP